jgi:RND family efflux transporter MFP subunit
MNGRRAIRKSNKMKKIIIALISSAFIISCGHKNEKQESLETGNIIAVKVARVQSENVSGNITATGLITTENEAKLSFKISGVIDRIFVSEGQFIKKGQVLATIKITEINSQLAQANLAMEKAQRDYIRANNLYNDSVVTLEQLQNAKTGLDLAKKSVDVVAFNRQFASITATADGFVTKKIANQGEVVSSGIPVLVINEIRNSNDWELKVGLTDKEWALISPGQKAIVELDAFPNRQFSAYVFRKSQAADQMSGSFQVELKINTGNEKPAIGMFGKATILSNEARHLYTIPYEAIIQADGNKAYVFVPQPDSSVKKIEIVIQSFNKKNVIIQSGVEAGQQVIVSNSAYLNEQSKVSIEN